MMDFEMILKLSQAELKEALQKELQGAGYTATSKDGFLYAPGTVPVLLVAHLDTVHEKAPSIICYSRDNRVLMSPQGIGGDDRAGVYMILEIIKQANCHVLFCEDEEIGGIGAKKFVKSNLPLPVYYIIELDRQGHNDAVYYHCNNPEFTTFVDEFGFEKKQGTFSDISVIAPHYGIAAVNISTGYYNAHRTHEIIDMKAVQYNIKRVVDMVNAEYGPFKYVDWQVNTKPSGQCSIFDLEEDTKDRKALMPLPKKARLYINECEMTATSSYVIDRNNNIYYYSEELQGAVESLNSYACDAAGNEIQFDPASSKIIPIVPFDEAVKKLAA